MMEQPTGKMTDEEFAAHMKALLLGVPLCAAVLHPKPGQSPALLQVRVVWSQPREQDEQSFAA